MHNIDLNKHIIYKKRELIDHGVVCKVLVCTYSLRSSGWLASLHHLLLKLKMLCNSYFTHAGQKRKFPTLWNLATNIRSELILCVCVFCILLDFWNVFAIKNLYFYYNWFCFMFTSQVWCLFHLLALLRWCNHLSGPKLD